MKKALIGLHAELERGVYVGCCNGRYEVTAVGRVDEMRARVLEGPFDLYFMDLNLGHPGSPDVSPAIEIWGMVRERVEQGLTKFLGISAADAAVAAAKADGIPALLKDWKCGEEIAKFLSS